MLLLAPIKEEEEEETEEEEGPEEEEEEGVYTGFARETYAFCRLLIWERMCLACSTLRVPQSKGQRWCLRL